MYTHVTNACATSQTRMTLIRMPPYVHMANFQLGSFLFGFVTYWAQL